MVYILTFLLCVSYSRTSTALLLNFGNNACKHLGDYPTMIINPDCYFNPDVGQTTGEIIQNHGLQVESYNVTTRDGYILQMFRIPPGKDDNRKNKQPIYLEHGILTDSSSFVLAGNRSLALSLASDGYDVWLGNHRGSIYSRGHTTFKTSDQEYWNFTLDTVAANDIPARLQKIAQVTGKAGSIIYVGHSRGTILGFMYLLNHSKTGLLRGMVALAPVAYLDPQIHIGLFFTLAPVLEKLFELIGKWALVQNSQSLAQFNQFLCPLFPEVCHFLLMFYSGQSDQFFQDDLLNVFTHVPSAFSLKEMVHMSQLMETGRLQKFDYGKDKNLEMYGQAPPVYDLGRITLPVYMFYAKHDVFVSEKSTVKQFKDLGSTRKEIFKIPVGVDAEESQWGHLDFLYGNDLKKFVYEPLKRVLEEKLKP